MTIDPRLPFDEAHAYLAAIITSSDDAIISKDLNGNITSWNPAAERIFGYTAEEAVGKHITVLIPPENLSEEDYIISKVRAGERVEHFQTVRRAKDGRLIDISVTVSPIKDRQGRIIGASKVARDVGSMKEAERSSSYLSAIIESSDDAIVSKNLNSIITSWNKSAERIFGYSAEEAVGKHISLIIPTERLGEEDKIISTLRSGERVDHFETWRRRKDGKLIPISVTVSPIRDSKGTIVGASKVARDISDRIEAERAILDAAQKKDEFIANMSHELRTPMNAVIGLSNLLMVMDDLPPKAKMFIDTLKLSADNLLDLINDLLDFAKIENGAVELDQIEFSLAEQVEKVISMANVRAREKGINLYVQYEPVLNRKTFVGDPLRLHQILMNLVSNAIKFTDKGSVQVSLTTTEATEPNIMKVNLTVTDTGIGIQADKVERVFDKFMQADSSITRRYGGSGLGLAITKAFVEKMGGTIGVTSEYGVGSTFTVTLPLKFTEASSTVQSFSVNIAPELPKHDRNVLIVEDYEPNVLVVASMLEGLGYSYETAQNGFEALRKFGQNQYDVILMDLQMHELDGLEATRMIRKIEMEKNITKTPIVAMTAHVRDQDKNKCFEAGMDDFIPKPFDPALLAQKLARFIDFKQKLKDLAENSSREGDEKL
ncbi:MAG: sensor hybrid histidine kinase [Micavibrio sp.]|nr:sensor hybrid histidine kinase [Micavibrio sp.]